MDNLERSEPSPVDTEGYVVSGWAALERGDLQGARAALQDLYSADPTHPALPLLAAGIRRVRPKHVPWRGIVLLIAAVVAGVAGVRLWNRHYRVMQQPTRTAKVSSLPQSTAALPLSTPAPAEIEHSLGTAGRVQSPAMSTAKPDPSSKTIDDDVIVRQAIKRFEVAYRNRWGELIFEHCDVSREIDRATAICLPRPATDAPEADRAWTFSLRKAEGGWRITSVQAPSRPHH